MPSFPRTWVTGANLTNPFGDTTHLSTSVHIAHMTQPGLASFTHLKAWGDPKKFHSDVAFLLVLPKEGAVGECTGLPWCGCTLARLGFPP